MPKLLPTTIALAIILIIATILWLDPRVHGETTTTHGHFIMRKALQ